MQGAATSMWTPSVVMITWAMMPIHIVQPAEHLLGIAAAYGFHNPMTIWNDAENQKVREGRKDPDALLPGDELWIPELQPARFSVATGRLHRFTIATTPLKLRVRLLDVYGEPIANTEVELRGTGVSQSLVTDETGLLEAVLPRSTSAVELLGENIRYQLVVGGLDPAESATGFSARLANLGFAPNDARTSATMDLRAQFSTELFADAQQIDLKTATADDVIQKLEEVYGC